MQSELKDLLKIVKDEKLKKQLIELDVAYDLILENVDEENFNYPNVKKLRDFYIPNVIENVKKYLDLTFYEKYSDRELDKFKLQLLEVIFHSKLACSDMIREIQEFAIMEATADLKATQICLELDGVIDSFAMTVDRGTKTETFEEILLEESTVNIKSLNEDPFAEPSERKISKLKAGYKANWNLPYEYIDDYNPLRTITNNKFSTIIDDIEINAPRAIKEVGNMLKSVLENVNICILPGIAYEGLKAAVTEIEGTQEIKLMQALKFDFLNKKVVINEDVQVKGETIVLLDSVCRTGKLFSVCKEFLLNAGAKSVDCIALAREVDYFPEERK